MAGNSWRYPLIAQNVTPIVSNTKSPALVGVLQRIGQHPASLAHQLMPRIWKEVLAGNQLDLTCSTLVADMLTQLCDRLGIPSRKKSFWSMKGKTGL